MKERNKKIINNKIKNIFSNQRGMALLTTLIFVFVLVTLAVALLTMTNNDSKMSTLQRASNKAFYLAETGIEKALYNLNVDESYPIVSEEGKSAWRPDDSSPFTEGTSKEYFELTIENIGLLEGETDDEGIIEIISTGIVNKQKFSSAQRKIKVIAKIDFFEYTTYKYAILADKLVLFHQDVTVNGDIHSNDDIEVTGNQFVDKYDGTATCSGDNNEVNSENTYVTPVPIPEINYSELYDTAVDEGEETHVYNGNYILQNSNETWSGIHYIKGNFTLKEGSTLTVNNGAIIVEGDVNMHHSAILEINKPVDEDGYPIEGDPFWEKPYAHLAIVATGDIELKNSSTTINGVVQTTKTNGEIRVKNGATIIGSAIATTVKFYNTSSIIYNEKTLSEITTRGDPFYKKTSWQEVY